MAWEFPNGPAGSAYPRPDPNVLGNALANLVSSYQGAQQGQQQTEANQRRLDLMKVFAGGVPTNPDGTPNLSAAMQSLAKAGDPNAVESLFPLIQEQQWQKSAKPSPALEGYGGAAGADSSFMGSLHQIESGNQNIFSKVDKDYPGQAGSRSQGYDQIDVPTWQQFAPVAGVDVNQYPTPMSDPTGVIQDKVASVIPFERFGPQTRAALEKKYGFTEADKGLTVGQLAAKYGRGVSPEATAFAPTQVASLGPTAVPDPNAPKIPPGSASAPDLPRSSAPTGALGTEPAWANKPGMGAINAALPVQGSPTGTAGAAPGTAGSTVAGMVSSVVQDPRMSLQVAANVASALHVDPRSPLTPEQAARAKTIIQNYAARTRQQPPPVAGQGQPQPTTQGQPLVPQFPLPYGLKPGHEMQAVARLTRDIANLSRDPNPYQRRQIPELEYLRDGILKQITPVPGRPGEVWRDPRTSQVIAQDPTAMRGGVTPQMVSGIAEAIEKGDQPPVLTGFYGAGPALRAQLAADGFDLSKHQLEWDAAKKQVTSLNGPQQVRFVGLANSVVNTVDEVNNLAQQMQLSGVPLLNKVELEGYIQTQGNSPNGQLATRYMTAVNTLKEEFANLANGGYAPTEPAWKLADQQINGNYGVEQLGAALTEAQRLIKYRLNAFPGLSTMGPGSGNQYMPGGGGQGVAPSSSVSAPAAGSGADGLPAGWSVKVR